MYKMVIYKTVNRNLLCMHAHMLNMIQHCVHKTVCAVCRLYGVYGDRRGGCAGCILRYNCYLLPRLDLASPASSAESGRWPGPGCRRIESAETDNCSPPAAAGHQTARVLSIVSRSSHHPDSDTDTDTHPLM